VVARAADRQVGRRIAHRLEVLEMPVRVPGLAFGRGAEQRRDVVLPFHVGLRGEIEIAAVRLRFAGERRLAVLVGPGAFQRFPCYASSGGSKGSIAYAYSIDQIKIRNSIY